MFGLEVRHKIDASHQLEDSEHLVTKQCARLHGHTYGFRVKIEENNLNSAGMVVDFKAIKNIIDELDHRHINDVFKEQGIEKQPTAENIAQYIYLRILAELGLVSEVWVAEGYRGEEWSSWAIYTEE